MCGEGKQQASMLTLRTPEQIVPKRRPPRKVREIADRTLAGHKPVLEEMYAKTGRLKTVAGFRKTRFRGQERTQLAAVMIASAYNLMRIARIQPGSPGPESYAPRAARAPPPKSHYGRPPR